MSDYLKKLIEQAEGGLLDWDQGLEELVADKENAVHADSFDKLAWRMLTESVPKLDAQAQRLMDEIGPTLAQALEDLFNLLHQGDPQFTAQGEMLPEYEINLIVLMELSGSEEFQALYNDTRYDEYATAFALLSMEQAIRETFEQVSQQREAMQQASQEQQEAMEQLRQAVDEAMQGDGGDESEAAVQEALARAEAASQAMDTARAEGQGAAQQAVQDLRQAAIEAKQELDTEQQALSSFGMEPGELQRMSFDERRDLALRLNRGKMADLAKLLGAFRSFGDAERRRKVQYAPAEVYDFELSNDLTRLAASEMTTLAVPELEDMFWARWAQHGLVTKKVRGPESLGQGPVIVVCDESGSMGQSLGDATREAWSKAVALALCDQAKRGKRDFTYIGFASTGQQWRMDLPGGVAPIEKVVEFVEHFLGGHTDFMPPLQEAMSIVEEYEQAGKPKPDIVLITDGDCWVPSTFVEAWQKVKQRADVTVYGIQVGGSAYYTSLSDLSDRVLSIDHLTATPEGVKDLFRAI